MLKPVLTGVLGMLKKGEGATDPKPYIACAIAQLEPIINALDSPPSPVPTGGPPIQEPPPTPHPPPTGNRPEHEYEISTERKAGKMFILEIRDKKGKELRGEAKLKLDNKSLTYNQTKGAEIMQGSQLEVIEA